MNEELKDIQSNTQEEKSVNVSYPPPKGMSLQKLG